MKILFIGTVEFSQKALQKLIDINSDVVGVCTKEKSSFNSDFVNLTPLCKKKNIPYKFVDNINSQKNIEWIESLKPDIIFCFGWSSLIKKELLHLPPMGVIGYHPAALPQNRGRHPLIWTLVLGLKKSASTFFFMEEGADDGDILSQKNFEILDSDDANTLYNKVIDIAISQIEDFVPSLESGIFTRIEQEHQKANIWQKRNKKDGQIDFRMTSKAIYNLVRALSRPYIGAHLLYDNQDITIWKVEIVEFDFQNIESGKVIKSDENTITVKTYDGAIKILKHEFKVLPKTGEYL